MSLPTHFELSLLSMLAKLENPLPIGTRIRFRQTLDAPADENHPAIIYAQKDQLGTITGHGTIEGYWVKADGCDSAFGAFPSEIAPLFP